MSVGHTRAASLGPIARCVEARGGAIGRVFALAGLPVAILDRPDLPLRLADHYGILGAAARVTGEAVFGAVLGQSVHTQGLGAYGRFVTSAPTLALAIDRAGAALNAMMQTNTDLVLRPAGRHVLWSMIFRTPGHEGRYQNELLALGYLLDTLRLYLGADWTPARLRVIGDARRASLLEKIFRAPVEPGHEACGIEFAAHLLATTRPDISVPVPGSELEMPGNDLLSPAAIRAAAEIEVLSGTPSAPRIAQKLGVPLRTLQRALATRGTSLSDLVATLRYGEARRLLAGPLGIAAIADALGYADAAHFTRAFRRWAGIPPAAYRASGG